MALQNAIRQQRQGKCEANFHEPERTKAGSSSGRLENPERQTPDCPLNIFLRLYPLDTSIEYSEDPFIL
jgi:hypothetical protein